MWGVGRPVPELHLTHGHRPLACPGRCDDRGLLSRALTLPPG